MKVLYRLKNAGYEGYLVGGGVRDLLLGREPKDFDVVTDARPEELKGLFRNCRLIGRRFRLAHVRFGREVIEVATFRGEHDAVGEGGRVTVNGRIVRDNAYGTLEEDAWRRDFSVNCLYYNIRDFSVIDFTGGMPDLESGTLRLLGEPAVRYREDAVRILRAIRFAAKLGFRIHPDTEAPIWTLSSLLREIPPARLYEEVLKLFHGGTALQSFELLRHYGVFGHLFPDTEACLAQEEDGFPRMLIVRALANTDARIIDDKPVTPAFLFAALLWEPLRRLVRRYQDEGFSKIQAYEAAGAAVIAGEASRVAIPRRVAYMAQEIWAMQPRLDQRRGKRALQLVIHPRFRAAYDFLCLRAETGEDLGDLVHWWTEFQTADDAGRLAALEKVGRPGTPRRTRRRKQKAG